MSNQMKYRKKTFSCLNKLQYARLIVHKS